MKPETYLPLYVAIVAAAASVFGVLYNQHASLQLERQKWQQSVDSERSKTEREAVAEFTKAFSASFYLAKDLLSRIEMSSSSLTRQDFLTYAKASDALKPKLVTAEAMLAGASVQKHARVEAALAEYYRIDEVLIVTGRNIDTNRAQIMKGLNDEVDKFSAFRSEFLKSLSAAAMTETTK